MGFQLIFGVPSTRKPEGVDVERWKAFHGEAQYRSKPDH
jgi:hypothetical protein